DSPRAARRAHRARRNRIGDAGRQPAGVRDSVGIPTLPRSSMESLKERIRHVPDFPKPGILFYDVTTLLKDPDGFQMAIEAMSAPHRNSKVDLVVGIESRGFIFGSAIADRLKTGFAPVPKLGKLPAKTRRASYALDAGSDSLEIHEDAVSTGAKVLVVDDLLATGGTAAATVGLVRGLGGGV